MPFQVPAVIVLNEALPKPAAPVKEEVPVTERAEIEVVVKVPWPPWAMRSVLFTLIEVVAFTVSAVRVPVAFMFVATTVVRPVTVWASSVVAKTLSHLIADEPRSEVPPAVEGTISISAAGWIREPVKRTVSMSDPVAFFTLKIRAEAIEEEAEFVRTESIAPDEVVFPSESSVSKRRRPPTPLLPMPEATDLLTVATVTTVLVEPCGPSTRRVPVMVEVVRVA